MFCLTAAASYWDNPVRVCLLSGVWWSWWTILKSKRRSMLNWTPFLERRTWLQSQTLATTNCHISLLLSSKLWGFIWRFHSLSPTWTSMTPRLLDMTFHLRANPGECMVDCKHTQNTGTNLKSSSQIVSWMQTLRWEAMISVFFHFGAGRWSSQESSSPFHCFQLCLDTWSSHLNFFLLQVWSRLMPQIYCNTINCGGQANLAWLLCWSPH